ncbi:hypothetical protein DUNSADRAFT_9365 [Dunaliella salina]|uniref:TPM domain-containing protein n=1 Tax=Dunaliella salina TaxID=3046 RepID=A0ABQ7H5H0_DUNSA|nr:hypothetical protein DUNSADRAFT_9365 [Dunaliella salina]|eukprot:KAF5842105.1 hypothetical protein DUNSADRAFT_9365 [Dunaliella salina]
MQTKLQQTPLKAMPAKVSSKGVSRCVLPPRNVVAKAAHNETSNTTSLGQRFAAAGAATLMSASVLAGGAAPALASEFDLLAEPKPETSYYIDDAGALSKSTKGDLDKKLKELEEKTGYRVEVLTLRKLEYETDAFAYTDKILRNWYPSKEELDNKGAILVMTSGKEGAVTGGDSFMNAVGEELLDSIVGDQIPIYTEQEKYNLTVESTVDRIAAKLEGKEVPGEYGTV